MKLPVLGFAAWSGSGKTTLLVKTLPLLKQQGIRVAMIKHAHHRFDIDQPGKDSYELRHAGATQMLIGSSRRWAHMFERHGDADITLDELLPRIDTSAADLILVEGFKDARIDKIEVHRPALGKPLLSASNPDFIAIATDDPAEISTELPILDLNQPRQLVEFILSQYGLGTKQPPPKP